MKRDRWYGYIKDYDGATLMEFCIDKRVDYLSTKRVADQQRKAIMQVKRLLRALCKARCPRRGMNRFVHPHQEVLFASPLQLNSPE
jgi:hypothetical protein